MSMTGNGKTIFPHYLLVTFGATGDIYPFMWLAKALQAHGRSFTLISNTHFADMICSEGLPFVGLGTKEDYLDAISNPDIWHPRKGLSALLSRYGEKLTQIHDAIARISADLPKGKDCIALCHPLAIPGASLARETGSIQGLAAAYLAPSNLRTCHDPLKIGPTSIPIWVPMAWRRAMWHFVEKVWIDPVAVPQVNSARTLLRLPPIKSWQDHLARASDLSVSLFPTWFGQVQPDWPQPFVSGDFPLFEAGGSQEAPPQLAAFLADGDAPLVFTFGTSNIHSANFFATAIEATERLNRRAVLLTRARDQLPVDLPTDRFLWLPYAPLNKLLPHAAAFVHHGGIGTTAEALRAAVPQLVVPSAYDQFDNGSRIAHLGAGISIPAAKLSRRKLVAGLRQLLERVEVRPRCRELARRHCNSFDPAELIQQISDHMVN